ncbi:MAG: CUAEP/CCAEP-tail radical SAM (seleno)protein, partial [Gemmatimonadales bacterium]
TAVESLSDRVLGHLDKGHTRADVAAALSAVREAGIVLRPSFVAFTPWTTLDDYVEMLDFVEREGLIDHVDPIQYGIRLLVPPGSLLLEQAALRQAIGSLDERAFSHRWEHPDPRMDALHREVTALVAEAAEREEDPGVTFYRIRDLALARRAGGPLPSPWSPPDPKRPRAPRLTEPWFC